MLIPSSALRRNLLTVLGASVLALVSFAQQPAPPPVRDYSPSDATAEMLQKYKTTVDAKNYEVALGLLDGQLAKVPADSYDAALLYQLKVQTLLQKGDYDNVISPLEKSLALSDAKSPTYFDEKTTRELVYFLAQLYLQEAVKTKDRQIAEVSFDKADHAMARWLQLNPKTTPEAQLIYSQLLYNHAVIIPDHPNKEMLKRALEQVEIGLHLSAHPKDTLYILKLVCLQQLDRTPEALGVLEYLASEKPDSATYWQQLASLYLGTGQDLRAIISIERAQTHGLMNSPKDNYNLIGMYFNLGQYEKAAELLETDLHSGKIESDSQNWELLASAYQQINRPSKAIDALKEATRAFPESGELEFKIAQVYQQEDQPTLALPFLESAVKKGNLTKPYSVNMYLSYVAYELKKFDVALAAAKRAAVYPEGAKDGNNMVKAIEEALKEREAKKSKM